MAGRGILCLATLAWITYSVHSQWVVREPKPVDLREEQLTSSLIQIPFSNGPFQVYGKEASDSWWRGQKNERWQMGLFQALNQELTAGTTYVGIGEGIGASSLFAVRRAKRAVLIESDPVSRAELAENVLANDPFHIVSLDDASCVSDLDGRCTTLPRLFERHGITTKERLFLKIDAEGTVPVFRFAAPPPALICCWNPTDPLSPRH